MLNCFRIELLLLVVAIVLPIVAFSEPDYNTYDASEFSVEYPSDWQVENKVFEKGNSSFTFLSENRSISVVLSPTNLNCFLIGFNRGNFSIPRNQANFSYRRFKPPAENEAPLGTRENPLPIGEYSLTTFDKWKISVISVIPNATDIVLEENTSNYPPKAGYQFFLARIRACYVGSGSDEFKGPIVPGSGGVPLKRLKALGASNVVYKRDDLCGVIPDPLPDSEVLSGECLEGYVGWEIKSTDATSLVMFDGGPVIKGEHKYLSLVP